jgi:hypothetical protein
MTIASNSPLEEIAADVSEALRTAGIQAVLTGGACATLHSGGSYQSEDIDLILQSSPSQKALDAAMASVGFVRARDHYVHRSTAFFVEFPRGPLSIGSDLDVRPVKLRVGERTVTSLSATDSCRDRLAAFYHWSDRQSLETAIQIALRKRVDIEKIRTWSVQEGATERFAEFEKELGRAKKPRRRRTGGRS